LPLVVKNKLINNIPNVNQNAGNVNEEWARMTLNDNGLYANCNITIIDIKKRISYIA